MHEEQEVTQTTPETDSAAEFEELIQGRCKQPFQQRVQKILDGRLRSLRQENEALRRQAAEQRSFENGCVERLARQAEDIRRVYGGFDWQREMRDPAFGRLIAAGVDGRTAYEVVHSRELLAQAMRYGAKRAAEQCSRAIASGGRRVAENGGHGSSAVTRTDPKALDSAQLADIRRRVQRGRRFGFEGAFRPPGRGRPPAGYFSQQLEK